MWQKNIRGRVFLQQPELIFGDDKFYPIDTPRMISTNFVSFFFPRFSKKIEIVFDENKKNSSDEFICRPSLSFDHGDIACYQFCFWWICFNFSQFFKFFQEFWWNFTRVKVLGFFKFVEKLGVYLAENNKLFFWAAGVPATCWLFHLTTFDTSFFVTKIIKNLDFWEYFSCRWWSL